MNCYTQLKCPEQTSHNLDPLYGYNSGRRMASSGMLRRVALVRIDVSEELSASFIRVTRIDEPRTLAVRTSALTQFGMDCNVY
jgi:hypothetical protein